MRVVDGFRGKPQPPGDFRVGGGELRGEAAQRGEFAFVLRQ
jgi:hypothetical protein